MSQSWWIIHEVSKTFYFKYSIEFAEVWHFTWIVKFNESVLSGSLQTINLDFLNTWFHVCFICSSAFLFIQVLVEVVVRVLLNWQRSCQTMICSRLRSQETTLPMNGERIWKGYLLDIYNFFFKQHLLYILDYRK